MARAQFLVFLVGLPGILQKYVGQCKDLVLGAYIIDIDQLTEDI